MKNNMTYFDNFKMVLWHSEGLTNKETKETHKQLSKVMLDNGKPRYTNFNVIQEREVL